MHHLKTSISISTIKKPATIHRRTHLFPSNSNAPQGKSTSAEPQVIALGPKAAEGYLGNVNHGRNGKIDLGPPKACCEHWAKEPGLLIRSWGFGIWRFQVIALTISYRPQTLVKKSPEIKAPQLITFVGDHGKGPRTHTCVEVATKTSEYTLLTSAGARWNFIKPLMLPSGYD